MSDILSFLEWSHQSNLRGQKGKRGIVSLKGKIDKAQKRREEKDLFENVVEKNLSYGLASF